MKMQVIKVLVEYDGILKVPHLQLWLPQQANVYVQLHVWNI